MQDARALHYEYTFSNCCCSKLPPLGPVSDPQSIWENKPNEIIRQAEAAFEKNAPFRPTVHERVSGHARRNRRRINTRTPAQRYVMATSQVFRSARAYTLCSRASRFPGIILRFSLRLPLTRLFRCCERPSDRSPGRKKKGCGHGEEKRASEQAAAERGPMGTSGSARFSL